MNFVLSGAAIALLARLYMRRSWSLSGGRVTVVALAASVLTNPTWAVYAASVMPGPATGPA